MFKEQIIQSKKELEQKFIQLESQRKEIEAEQFRIQGEYRLLVNMEQETKVEEKSVEATPEKVEESTETKVEETNQ